MESKQLTQKQIGELDLSGPIKQVFKSAGYSYLSELLAKSPEELMDIPGLTLAHVAEYKKFLIRNRLQKAQNDF